MNFIKRVVGKPGDTIAIRNGHVFRNGKREKDPYINDTCNGDLGRGCNLPVPDQGSGRALVHDGRQPWGLRRQPLLGTGSPQLDHRLGLRHLLAAQAHRAPLASATVAVSDRPSAARTRRTQRRKAKRPAGAWSSTTAGSASAGSRAPTRPGAAAWPARSSRPPSCSTSTAWRRASVRALAAAQRLQAARRGGARGALPGRPAHGGQGRRGLSLRARHRRSRPAPHEPRGAARRAAARRASRARCAWSTASASPTWASSSAR